MLEVSVSQEGLDPEWDNFLETMPDGCYQQSSLWARLKATIGWKHLRLVVREQGRIVGGAQALLRPLPLFGDIGYVSKGPIIASDDPAVQGFVLDQLDRVARAKHILFLKIQPPYGAEDLAQRLLERGALPNEIDVTPLATARVDIRPDPDAIQARMRSKTRSNIRRAERRGVTVHEGTEADISTFHRLLEIQSERLGYEIRLSQYAHNLWSIFAPRGHACLLVAEYEGEALAARMNMAFGDTGFDLFVGDSGCRRNLNAQSLLQWKAMLWDKEHGCAWYDLGGIYLHEAWAFLNNQPFSDTGAGRRARFKMSFGGQLVFRPGVYDVSYLWPRRLTGRMVPVLSKMPRVLNFLIGSSLTQRVRRRAKAAKERKRNGL